LQAAQVKEQVTVVAWLDQWTDSLQISQDGFEHGRRADRVGLQDHGVGTQRHDFAQGQACAHARRFGFRRAQLDDFALAWRAAEDERSAIPSGMPQHFDPQWQLRNPNASNPYVGPQPTPHPSIIERVF
jgi:hypothetical protein